MPFSGTAIAISEAFSVPKGIFVIYIAIGTELGRGGGGVAILMYDAFISFYHIFPVPPPPLPQSALNQGTGKTEWLMKQLAK